MKQSELPEGWDEERVRDLLDYYENQSEDQAAAEYETACSSTSEPMMGIPAELVPKVREMIAGFRRKPKLA